MVGNGPTVPRITALHWLDRGPVAQLAEQGTFNPMPLCPKPTGGEMTRLAETQSGSFASIRQAPDNKSHYLSPDPG
jgi:hypothetical protein